MATSGRINGSYAASSYAPYVKWSVTQSIPNNKSTMSVTFGMRKASENSLSYNLDAQTLTLKVNGTTYTRSITFDFRTYSAPSDHDIVTISGIEIPHNADGTKSVSISASHPTDISLGTGSVYGTASLDTIPRATKPEVPTSATIGDTITITLNRASSGFTHNLAYKLGNGSYRSIADGVGTSQSWTIPTSLCDELTSAASGTVTIRAITYNGSTTIGTQTATMTVNVPSTLKPTAGMTTALVNENTTVAGWGVAIKGFTKVSYTIAGDATDDRGATIAAYQFSGNGETISGATGTTGVLATAGSVVVRGRVQDTRGRWSDWADITLTVLDYSAPEILSSSAERVDANGDPADDGESVKVRVNGQVTAAGNNTATAKWRYRQAEGGWSAYATIANNEYVVLPTTFSKGVTYEIELSVWDDLGNTKSVVYTIPTASVAVNIRSGGTGIGIGKYNEHDGEIEIEETWDIRYHGAVMVDHVIEQGTTGNWTYVKWASGRAEAWGVFAFNSLPVTQAWGSLYETAKQHVIFPVGLFVAVPNCQLTQTGNSASFLELADELDATRSQNFWFVRATSLSSANFTIHAHVTGRWK